MSLFEEGPGIYDDETPLHHAAGSGSPEQVAELAGRVQDVDSEFEGRTALWVAVYEGRHDNARALVAAGADPWRPMMSGWSPGRLSLAGPEPGLFDPPAGVDGLTNDEAAAAAEAKRLTAALGERRYGGTGLACVAAIGAAEAVRRLQATVGEVDPEEPLDRIDPFHAAEERMAFLGVTDVPGGCVVTQPWGPMPQTPAVTSRLSAGTVCHGLFVIPKGGTYSSILRDGEIVGWDLNPGGPPWDDDEPLEVLLSYLYRDNAVAYCCAYAGLRLSDARAVTGPPDLWVRLPERHYPR
jgi:hypothetical protein